MLENVAKKETAAILQPKLRELGYVTRCFFINSAAFALPQSRARLYCIAVHPSKVAFRVDPSEWKDQLEARPNYIVFLDVLSS